MLEAFCCFLFHPCPSRCVFILPHWTRKEHAVPHWPACWCNAERRAKNIPPCAGTRALLLLGRAAPSVPGGSPVEDPTVEDPYWEGSETGFSWRCGFPQSCCFQGMKLKFLFITTFLEDPILRHPNAHRSTEAKQHHSLLKTLTSSPPPTSQSAYIIQTGEGWRALVASLPKLHLRQSWLPYWEQALE